MFILVFPSPRIDPGPPGYEYNVLLLSLVLTKDSAKLTSLLFSTAFIPEFKKVPCTTSEYVVRLPGKPGIGFRPCLLKCRPVAETAACAIVLVGK
jgi:hypothetical protein